MSSPLFGSLLVPALTLALGPGVLPGPGLPRPQPKGRVPLEPIGPVTTPPRCDTVTVAVPDVTLPPLLLHGGDSEVNGHAKLDIEVELVPSVAGLRMVGQIDVESTKSRDDTHYRRYFEQTLRVLSEDSRCQVQSVVGGLEAELSEAVSHQHRFIDFYGSHFLDKAECRLDSNGDDDGKVQCRRLHFRSIRVRTEPRADIPCNWRWAPLRSITLPVHEHTRGDT